MKRAMFFHCFLYCLARRGLVSFGMEENSHIECLATILGEFRDDPRAELLPDFSQDELVGQYSVFDRALWTFSMYPDQKKSLLSFELRPLRCILRRLNGKDSLPSGVSSDQQAVIQEIAERFAARCKKG